MDILNTSSRNEMDSHLISKYPQLGFIISFSYLILVKKVLPDYMKNRPPYQFNTFLRIYNLFQVFINSYMVLMVIHFISFKPGVWSTYWTHHCHHITHHVPHYMDVANNAKIYVYVKILDLFDTVFIVLKKKGNQLSFLHLFHHSMMVIISFISYADKEQLAQPIIMLNSFVHAIMYSYYLVASFENAIWVRRRKKYVTQLQINQFLLILLYMCYAFYYQCPWGQNSLIMWYLITIVLFYQFCRFYCDNYYKNKVK